MSDYALIIEDDVRFLYNLNFSSLISSAPSHFGILQLSTSNEVAIEQLWADYMAKSSAAKKAFLSNLTADSSFSSSFSNSSNPSDFGKLDAIQKQQWLQLILEFESSQPASSLWTQNTWTSNNKNGKEALYWSAQAYLVNKKVVKQFIDDVVTVESDGTLTFKIVNSFYPNRCQRTKKFPCVLSNCLFSDTYIYAGGGPTFVSHIPLFSGASIGLQSEVHQDHVAVHVKGFDKIERVTSSIRGGMSISSLGDLGGLDALINSSDMTNSLWVPSYILNPRTCRPPFGA